MFSKFEESTRKILIGAKKEMNLLKHPYVGSEHLLLSILRQKNELSDKLKKYNLEYNAFKSEIINAIGMGTKESEWFLYTPLLKKIIEEAVLSSKSGNVTVTPESLLIALLEEGDGVAIRILISMGINLDDLYEEINNKKEVIKKKNNKKLLIEEYGVNLNKKVTDGEIDPVIGRDKEIERVIEILCRRIKNNPLLIGEAGVGKTAIVEELCRRIVDNDVPPHLSSKKIYSVSMASIVAGTKYRGEFEERVTKMLKEVEENEDIILFIDEIHTLVGAGGAEGAIDASNILKPALARGKVRVIGATTTIEYKKVMETDKALTRRFQIIVIEEADDKTVYNILKTLKPIYEQFHNVTIDDEILNSIVSLTNKYIYDRKQPDKAIDILDEAASMVAVQKDIRFEKRNYYIKLLDKVNKMKNEEIINNQFVKATMLKEEERKLETAINSLDVKLTNKKVRKVTLDIVASAIENKTSIPVYELNNNFKIIDEIKNDLTNKIFGQDEALDNLLRYTKRILMGHKSNNRPVTFLFVGPTGVGKTYIAKEYNKKLFNSKKDIIRMDMSEYKEEHSISKIIGSPPGYVGFSEKNTVLEEIKNNPYSVILLDEIEKAHPSVINLFLQIFDEGKIKDSSGNICRFDNTIIIMTSNAGCTDNKIGFDKEAKDIVLDKVKKYFSLEFINRIDKIIMFNSLKEEDVKNIISLKLDICKEKYNINFDEDTITDIVKLSNYELFGARKIDKIIDEKLDLLLDDIYNYQSQ